MPGTARPKARVPIWRGSKLSVNTRTISARKAKLFGGGIQRMALNRVTLAGGSTDATVRAQQQDEDER